MGLLCMILKTVVTNDRESSEIEESRGQPVIADLKEVVVPREPTEIQGRLEHK